MGKHKAHGHIACSCQSDDVDPTSQSLLTCDRSEKGTGHSSGFHLVEPCWGFPGPYSENACEVTEFATLVSRRLYLGRGHLV